LITNKAPEESIHAQTEDDTAQSTQSTMVINKNEKTDKAQDEGSQNGIEAGEHEQEESEEGEDDKRVSAKVLRKGTHPKVPAKKKVLPKRSARKSPAQYLPCFTIELILLD
jgi:hypothetical protein